MAQVRKYQGGGENDQKPVTPDSSKQAVRLEVPGKFRMNGREISGQLALDRITPYLASYTSGVQQALLDGMIVEYDPIANSPYIHDSEGTDHTLYYLPVAEGTSVDDSQLKKDLQATFRTKKDAIRRQLSELRKVDMSNNVTPTEKIKVDKGSGWFGYDKDSGGKDTIFRQSAMNNNYLRILDDMQNYFEERFADEDSAKKKYVVGWKSSADIFFRAYKNKSEEERKQYWKTLKDHILHNKFTNADIDDLQLLGWRKLEEDSGSTSNKGDDGGSNKDSGGDPTKGGAIVITRDGSGETTNNNIYTKDGINYIVAASPYSKNKWQLSGIKDFEDTIYHNGFAIDGRLYTAQEASSLSNSDLFRPWFEAFAYNNWRDRYDAWNNSGFRFLGDRNWGGTKPADYYGSYWQRFNLNEHYAPNWYEYFIKNKDKFGDNVDMNLIDNLFSKTSLGRKHVLMYVDPNAYDNLTGIYTPQYLVQNEDGSFVKANDYSDLIEQFNFAPLDHATGNSPITMSAWTKIRGKDYAIYQNFGEEGKQNAVLIDRDGNFYLKRGDRKPKPIDITEFRNLMRETNGNPSSAALAKLQEGGTILKFQAPAESLPGVYTTEEPQTVNDAQSYYTESHPFNDLTPWEISQLTAAGLECVSAGLAWGKNRKMGLASAITGATGSTAQFVSDIGQDGFQWTDLGSYLGNLALDATSLIPIKNNRKVTRFKQLMIKAGPVLTKAATLGYLGGISAPQLMAAFKRWSDGGDFTSQDLELILRTAAAVSRFGASWNKNNQLSRTANEYNNSAVSGMRTELKFKYNGVTKTGEDVMQAIRQAGNVDEAEKAIQELFKNGDKTLSGEDLENLIKQLNLKTVNVPMSGTFKERLGTFYKQAKSWRNPFKDSKYVGTSEVIDYRRSLGNTKAYDTIGNSITRQQYQAILDKLNSGIKLTPSEVGVLNAAVASPWSFPEGFFGTDTKIGYKWNNGYNFNYRPLLPAATEGLKHGGNIPKYRVGGEAGFPYDANVANLFDFSRGAASAWAIYKDRDIQRDALGKLQNRQFLYPWRNHIVTDLSQIERGIKDASEPYNSMEYKSTDSRDNIAFELSRSQKINDLINKGNAAKSDQIYKIKTANQSIDEKQLSDEITVANTKSQYFTNLGYQKRMLDSAALNQLFSKVLNPLGQQFGQQIRDAQTARAKTEADDLLAEARKVERFRQNKALRGELNGRNYIDEWQAMSAEEKAKYSNNIEDWIYSEDPEAYKKIYELSSEYTKAVREARDRQYRIIGGALFYNKRGGSIRPATDQIAINTSKNSQKAADDLSKDLRKMLHDLMKLK